MDLTYAIFYIILTGFVSLVVRRRACRQLGITEDHLNGLDSGGIFPVIGSVLRIFLPRPKSKEQPEEPEEQEAREAEAEEDNERDEEVDEEELLHPMRRFTVVLLEVMASGLLAFITSVLLLQLGPRIMFAEVQTKLPVVPGTLSISRDDIRQVTSDHALEVVWVLKQGSADVAGVRVGDRIVAIDYIEYETPAQAMEAFKYKGAGKTFELQVIRGEEQVIVNVLPLYRQTADGWELHDLGMEIGETGALELSVTQSMLVAGSSGFAISAATPYLVTKVFSLLVEDPAEVAKVLTSDAPRSQYDTRDMVVWPFADELLDGLFVIVWVSFAINLLPFPFTSGSALLVSWIETLLGRYFSAYELRFVTLTARTFFVLAIIYAMANAATAGM